MADNRLDPDINLLGYWGFDEALETSVALDKATSFPPENLTVTNAVSVQVGRVGSAREFNGSSSYGTNAAARFLLLGAATFIGWFKLDTYNSGGSLLRAVLSCGGPTTGDNLLYGVYVDSAGRLVYKHTAAGGTVVVRSAAGIVKTAQYYCVMVRRVDNGGNHDIEFVLDNTVVPVADVTVNAVPSALPVPPPVANVSAVFSVGRSQKETDSAFWDGLLDEVSVHDIARSYQPYLRGAYYRIALRNPTAHLTAQNNVLNVSSADMGAGVRWWCYERDKDLFVVKESPLGVFGADTRLTTPGGSSATVSGKPELIYDSASDTLLVLFIAGNRIFKLTAQSTDDPATINMPFTADAFPAIKSLDNADGGAFGEGGGMYPWNTEFITYVNRTPVKVQIQDDPYLLGEGGGSFENQKVHTIPIPAIDFMARPAPDGFGVVVGPSNGRQSGYRVFRLAGGGNQLLGDATYKPDGHFYFKSISPIVGDIFYAEALDLDGRPTGTFSNAIAYRGMLPVLVGSVISVGIEGDGTETLNAGEGGGMYPWSTEFITYVNRTPVKISGEDAPSYKLGEGGGQHGKVTTSGVNRPGSLAIEVELQ